MAAKYKNIPTVVDNVRFASKKEANRYQELKLLQQSGKISDLDLQPGFRLHVNGVFVCTYIGDFQYFDVELQKGVLEDAKGFRTPAYKLKKKLMKAIHGIEIQEI